MTFIFAAVPISYTFIQNYKSFQLDNPNSLQESLRIQGQEKNDNSMERDKSIVSNIAMR